MRKQIAVGVDGSPTAQLALIWAAKEASTRGASLLIAHADDGVTGAVAGHGFRAALGDPARHAQQLVDAAAELIAARFPELPVVTLVQQRPPADLVLDLSRSASMIVLGRHGRNRLIGSLLGSTAWSAAARASCPVVLVGPDVIEGQHGCIAVGVSPSEGGQEAVRFAFEEAARRHAVLIAVRGYGVWGDPERGGIFGAVPGLRVEQRQLLEETLEKARAEFPEVDVRPRLIADPIQDVMPQIAPGVDLIVLGRPPHHHRWSSRLGQVTSIIPHQVPCPVAIVGAPQEAGDGQRDSRHEDCHIETIEHRSTQ